MTEEELATAQARVAEGAARYQSEKEAAEQLYRDRLAAGGVAPQPETALDKGIPRADHSGLPTAQEFAQESEARANLDIMIGLREIEGAESVRWQIYRLSDPTGRKSTGYVTEWSSDILSTARLQEEFGAGTYRVVGKRANGQYAAMRTVKIAEDSRTGTPTQTDSQSESAQGSTPMSEFMTMMLQQNEQRRQEDAERERREEARDERRRKERMELMTIAAPVVAAIVPALFGHRGPDIAALITATKGPSLAETLTVLRELNPPAAPVAPSGPSPIDTALKLFDKFTDLAPKAGGEIGWADVLKEVVRTVGPGVAPALAQIAAMRPPRAIPGQARLPAPVARPAAPPTLYDGIEPNREASSAPDALTGSSETASPSGAESQNPEGENMGLMQTLKMVPWLKGQLHMLIDRAVRDSDPKLYAEVVLDSIPEDISGDVLIDFLNKPEWLQTLHQFDSRVGQHQKWFTELRAEILLLAAEIKREIAEAKAGAPGATTPADQSEIPADAGPDMPRGPPSLMG